jgi:hypothetical protein
VRTAGIDLASQAAGTAACTIEWPEGGRPGARARVTSLRLGVDDRAATGLILGADKVGLDVPLGWPIAFVEAVSAHTRDGSWPPGYLHATDTASLRYRRTDLWLWRELGTSPPLSVSTDRLALPAMRAAALLSRLPDRLPRDNSGVIVEAYPAAALRRWGFVSRQYKRKQHRDARRLLVAAFVDRTKAWLAFEEGQAERCVESDDVFDAIITALIARAAALGLVEPVPAEERSAAGREGWIAVPRPGSLDQLAG